MIWGQTNEPPAHGLHARPPCPARNPLLLFEPRPAGPWAFEVKELAPHWARHIERLQQGDAGPRTMN